MKIESLERALKKAQVAVTKKRKKSEFEERKKEGPERQRRFVTPSALVKADSDNNNNRREYDGPIDREQQQTRDDVDLRKNEWTMAKEERARKVVMEKVHRQQVFVPVVAEPRKIQKYGDGDDDDAEDGEVKFKAPSGEMKMNAGANPYVPPSKAAAKTWTRPPTIPNRNKLQQGQPKIPDVNSRGFTRHRSVSPGIHAKDLAPWTMSEEAKKPLPTTTTSVTENVKEKPLSTLPETIPEHEEVTVPPPPPKAIEARTNQPAVSTETKRRTRSRSRSVEPQSIVWLKSETSKYTVKALKALLEEKALSTDGLKADLVKRLDEANNNA